MNFYTFYSRNLLFLELSFVLYLWRQKSVLKFNAVSIHNQGRQEISKRSRGSLLHALKCTLFFMGFFH